MPTSPESDGEIYLTPNTSVSTDDERKVDDKDCVIFEHVQPPPRSKNGYRIDKIQSMSSIANNYIKDTTNGNNHQRAHEKQFTNNADGQNGCIFRINSLGNLSQYERDFGSTPKSLLQLKEEFERRRVALLAQRNSLNNLLKNNNINEPVEKINGDNSNNGQYARSMHKKRIGIGDTKYIGTENDTPESKQYHLTKMKSLGTISDPLVNERITYDPFLTPMIPRRHPASLHSFEEEENHIRNDFNSDSGSSDEQENFLRHQPDEHVRFMHESNLLNGSFERGFRRSYNKKHDRPVSTTATGLRQSDGCFKMPLPVDDKQQFHHHQHHQHHHHRLSNNKQPAGKQPKNRSSVHSLPSDGKFEFTRYEVNCVDINVMGNKKKRKQKTLDCPKQ